MIDRRTFIQSAPVTMVASASLAAEPDRIDYNAAAERVRYFAGIIGRDAPQQLLDINDAPSLELLTFCDETGMSLDWVFLGDLKPMVLATYRDRTGAPADGTPIEALYARWEKANAKYNRLADEGEALLKAAHAAGNPDANLNDRDHERRFVDPAYLAMVEIETQIMEQPIEGPRDLAVKVVIALRVEGAHDDEQYRTLNTDALRLLSV